MGKEAKAQRSDMTCSASHSHLVVKVQLKRAVLAFIFLLQLRDTAPSSTSFPRMGWPRWPLLCGTVKTYGDVWVHWFPTAEGADCRNQTSVGELYNSAPLSHHLSSSVPWGANPSTSTGCPRFSHNKTEER